MKFMLNSKKQSGAVSIFIVIFVTLLVVIITTSFMRIMLNDQQQASNSDLSQSAYDSAQAGVEDAKRALMKYKQACGASAASADCLAMISSMGECNGFISRVLNGSVSVAERNLSAIDEGNEFDQAYTCTKITLDTPNYLGQLADDQSVVIPLYGVDDFNIVKVSWFSAKDLSTGSEVSLQNVIAPADGLPVKSGWNVSTPPIMRTQFVQLGGASPVSNTVFLYPSRVGTNTIAYSYYDKSLESMLLTGATGSKSPSPVKCNKLSDTIAYACSINVDLSTTVPAENKLAYLRLTAIYNKTNYKVSLFNGSTEVKFKEVQPEVDSTGRANSLYRRIKSRIELVDTNFPYPEAAVDTSGNFCKDFIITNEEADYNRSCNP